MKARYTSWLLGLSLLLHPNCGTELGNPSSFSSRIPDSTFTNNSTLYENSDFSYQLYYPNLWQIDATDSSMVVLDNGLAALHSNLTISAETLLDPITDLLQLIQSRNPGQSWSTFNTNMGLIGVIGNTDETLDSNGATHYDIYFGAGLILLHLEIISNPADNGSGELESIVNTVAFTPASNG